MLCFFILLLTLKQAFGVICLVTEITWSALKVNRCVLKFTCLHVNSFITFTFTHLTDAFIQSDVHTFVAENVQSPVIEHMTLTCHALTTELPLLSVTVYCQLNNEISMAGLVGYVDK